MSTTDRRSALAVMASGILGALGLRPARAAEAPPVPGAVEVFLTGRSVAVSAQSAPVRWRGEDYRLVRVGEARFFRSPLQRVTASLKASVLTFDNVEYEVHAALYDERGSLLGTARALCPVSRMWAGTAGITPVELHLDFGISKAYERAQWLTVGITERDVLTPDQWQKPAG